MAPKIQKTILKSQQSRILLAISKEKYFTDRFYFTGGTVLSEFYLRHRLSEDLDFFSEKKEVNNIYITRFFENHKNQLGIKKFDTRHVLGLFTVFFTFRNKKALKVDFNYYPFPRIEKGIKFGELQVDSILDIAVNKIHTVVLKPRARDFIDIYFIVKEMGYDFSHLLFYAKAKFDWDITALELGTRLLEAEKLTDYPKMLKKIDHREWRKFFIKEAKKLKKEILK